jgi:hypothetical protein
MRSSVRLKLLALVLTSVAAMNCRADVSLIAFGSISGTYEDLADSTADALENGVAGNRLGGIGSGLAYAGGDTFLALPDRGPNATSYASSVDDTASYINRFETLRLSLAPNPNFAPPSSPPSFNANTSLPFVLTPALRRTTLLWSPSPLVYGTGAGLQKNDGTPLGSGQPQLNTPSVHYFTGRSDGFDPSQPSSNPNNARLDPESIRVSNDGMSVFISDEYGPYVYQFSRIKGQRIRAFTLPSHLAVTLLSPVGQTEIDHNTVGRIANKGMEGLAITPDGKTLVGIMQTNLEQDAVGSQRIVTIDIQSGATNEYAYQLTDGTGVSEIVAVNTHQFLVDERDGKGAGDKIALTDTASAATVKKLYLIDLNGATEISNVTKLDLGSASNTVVPVTKTPFLDIVAKLTAAGIDAHLIPSKVEGVTFGQDVTMMVGGQPVTKHTLYVANDNDFLTAIADPLVKACTPGAACSRTMVPYPNQWFVFAFDDSDLPGYVPQQVTPQESLECGLAN